MSLITLNTKEYRSVTAQLMSQNLPIVSCSFGIFCVLRHPNHFVLAGANNRNVIITYRFLAAPVQANRDFFYIDCMTVYFNCEYFPQDTRELLECLRGISPSGRNPAGEIIKHKRLKNIKSIKTVKLIFEFSNVRLVQCGGRESILQIDSRGENVPI